MPAEAPLDPTIAPLTHSLSEFAGKTVVHRLFAGVEFAANDPLLARLSQHAGTPLDPDHVEATTRSLFATGRYRDISVHVQPVTGGVDLIFAGIPTYFVGRIEVHGINDDRLASLIEYGTNLNPGTPFLESSLAAATQSVTLTLAQNGYYQPKIAVKTTRDDAGQQINVIYTVQIGKQARVGKISISGKDPGITEDVFRRKSRLRSKTKVERETVSNALTNLRNYFQKQNRLEATVSLQRSTFDPATNTLNYDFQVEQGPIVQVTVEGAKVSRSRLHLLIPIYAEGTVDNDLLNEGRFNLSDYLQQEGYFAPNVTVSLLHPQGGGETVLYTVDKGDKRKVGAVTITGNQYFTTELLKANLKVQRANAYQRAGRFSNQLADSDAKTLAALYRANGFRDATVTAQVTESTKNSEGAQLKVPEIHVAFTIVEGTQQHFGAVALNGVDPARTAAIRSLLQATPGQPYSLVTLAGDRDTVLTYYLSNGYDKARIAVAQLPDAKNAGTIDIAYNITEGEQVTTGSILESGRKHTRQKTIDGAVRVHSGDPLDQTALVETQRNLYNLAIFNQVDTAIQNPAGDTYQKNVLLQLTEAKRWDVTYGFGFEVQTGVPTCGMYCTHVGTTAAQQGKAGASERVSLDVSRINLRGTDNSITFHGDYGLLEEVVNGTFNNPHLFGKRSLSGQITAGYSNVQNISTFASSTLQSGFHITEKFSKRDTFIYDFQFRQVAVDPNSLAIAADLIPLLSQPVRVGGPSITWFRDTRSPTPLDAAKGTYTSVSNFLANSAFGSQTNFDRVDASNSSYYQFGRAKYVFARNTRIGVIASSGTNPNAGTVTSPPPDACAGKLLDENASCNPVPLPERLYAGGANSHRGFPINGAGPRDLQTGFPVGGSAVFVNTFELRLPAPTLPYVGNSLSFVVFHDMGNVFRQPSQMFPSFLRLRQPNQSTCRVPAGSTATIGTCDFNYFSHAVGLGARYHTPVGPIRLDLSYNLNPGIYPVFPSSATSGLLPYTGQGAHFNFFFSIGQAF